MKRLAVLFALALTVTGCSVWRGSDNKTVDGMTQSELEVAVKDLENTCRAQNISMGSRAWDDCVKAEAAKRGWTK